MRGRRERKPDKDQRQKQFHAVGGGRPFLWKREDGLDKCELAQVWEEALSLPYTAESVVDEKREVL